MSRAAALLLSLVLTGAPARAKPFSPSPWLDFDKTPPAVASHCGAALTAAKARLDALASLPPERRDFPGTVAGLDRVLWDLSDETASDAFLMHVSVSSAVRQASQDCSTALEKFSVETFTREDLYRAVKTYASKKEALAGEDKRLLEKTLLDFKRNGLELSPEKRAELKALRQKLVELEQSFRRNIGEVKDTLSLSREELAGLPDDFLARLPRDGEKYKVSLDYPDYFPVIDNGRDPSARRRLEALFNGRASAQNLPLLREVLELRHKAARLLGYKDHASFVLEERMARSPRRVERFLRRLKKRLDPLALKERAELLALKAKEEGAASDGVLHAWDWRYYHNQLLKSRYDVDQEKIKEYFPLETVLTGMLSLYQKLLGVSFRKVPAPAAWHKSVVLYEITDAAGGPALGYFYMDLHPREGKYKHAAAFDLVKGRGLSDGRYQAPVSAIVANFSPSSPGRPSLLKHGEHGEVETFFHEFGHIMHQTLTRARHGRFSGTSVARDFVEAPSQMLENWVWDPAVLAGLSGRFDDQSKKLPKALLERMIAARDADTGLMHLRQVFFGTVDQAYHAGGKASDTTATYRDLMAQVSLVPMSPGTHPEASFGHLMGYDAGYYGYLWSKVFAQDMFTVFEAAGLLDPAVGRRYRKEILESGGSRDEADTLKAFLGREPSEEAFLKRLGLGPKE